MTLSAPPNFLSEAGFSLVELVTVIVLVGVLAAVALPRSIGTSGFSGRAAVDQALSGIRYAQQQAMSRGRLACFRYQDGGALYHVEYRPTGVSSDCASGSWEKASPHSPWELPSGTGFSGSRELVFDGLGALKGTPCPRPVNVGGGTITVECETGFTRAD